MREALTDVGITGMTVTEVSADKKGIPNCTVGWNMRLISLPKVKVEVIVLDEQVDECS